MRRYILGHGWIALGLLAMAAGARADEAADRAFVLALNKITGSDPIKDKVDELKLDVSRAQRLVKAGLGLVKEKKLTYNAALIMAQTAGELRDLKASEAFFRVCMEDAVTFKSTSRILEAHGGLIDLFFESKKYGDTVRICREVLELVPGDGKADYRVGKLDRDGELDYFRKDFSAGEPLDIPVRRVLTQAVAGQGKYDQALKLAENLFRDTEHWRDLQLKGAVLNEMGKFGDAARVYEEVLQHIAADRQIKDPEQRKEYTYRNRYILSHIYVDLKQIDRATEHLQKLLAQKPDDPGLLNDLGYIWADHDVKLDEAEKLIRRALELDRKRRKDDKDNGAYLDSLGWVLFKQKRYKEAKEALLKAVQDKSAQHIEIFDHLGDVHLALGEREAALAAWRKGLAVAGEGRRDTERRAIVEKKIDKHK